jgi:ubiquinone/menaquinone biosynthesis C-methylase UbiE
MNPIHRVRNFWESHVNNEIYTAQHRGTEAYFQEIATRRYQYHYHLPPWFDRIRDTGARNVLEVGCGIGIDTVELARRGLQMTAVDLTRAALEVARERNDRLQLPIRFLLANAETLPFADHTFDAVYSFGVLHHTPDMPTAVREVHRVLRPGGRAWIMLYARYSLVNAIHVLFNLPFESPKSLKDHCPVVFRSSAKNVRQLFAPFRTCSIVKDYPFTYGMRRVSQLVPIPLQRSLGRQIGWHLMVEAQK